MVHTGFLKIQWFSIENGLGGLSRLEPRLVELAGLVKFLKHCFQWEGRT